MRFLLVLALLASGTMVRAQFVTVGTGSIAGVYFPTGGAICRLLNRTREEHGYRCLVDPTGGSVDNIYALATGKIDFGVVQSDVQYYAYEGHGKFTGFAHADLRSMFSVHAEPFTLLARADSGISSFEGLVGKRVNVGNDGSGQRETMELVMEAFGVSMEDFAIVTEFNGDDVVDQICNGEIDAMIYMIGHPTSAVKEVTSFCDVVLVPVTGAPIDQLVAENPYYSATVIPGGMYANNPDDIATFGVSATVVTAAELPEDMTYILAKAVMENLAEFRGLHPAFANLDVSAMVTDGLSAPLHSGALRAYIELGLIDE